VTPSPPPTQPEGFIPDSSSSPGTTEPTKKDIFDDLKVVPGATPSPENRDLPLVPWAQQQPAATDTTGANDSEVKAVVFLIVVLVIVVIGIVALAVPRSGAAGY
jgi:hypothetical protein